MKRMFCLVFLTFFGITLLAQPANYYNSANGLTGNQLKVALHNIIKGHTFISYSQIWNAYWSTDKKGSGIVWDMYSDRPGGTPAYTYYLGQDQCGSSCTEEGDCYNREHSWPQSWFNEQSTPRTDLHHIFPTDGWVNNKRSNYPFGEVRSAEWTSTNGSKLGTCKTTGYSGTVFEPIDEYKGDFARGMMYMSVRYYGEDSGWKTSDMTNKSEIKSWAIDMLLRWNDLDPVSQKEIDRNNAIYNDYQHNRNPFVDHPEYARMIWDSSWSFAEEVEDEPIYIFPNPVEKGNVIHLSGNEWKFDAVAIYDLCGHVVAKTSGFSLGGLCITVPEGMQTGLYFVKLMKNGRVVKNLKLDVR